MSDVDKIGCPSWCKPDRHATGGDNVTEPWAGFGEHRSASVRVADVTGSRATVYLRQGANGQVRVFVTVGWRGTSAAADFTTAGAAELAAGLVSLMAQVES